MKYTGGINKIFCPVNQNKVKGSLPHLTNTQSTQEISQTLSRLKKKKAGEGGERERRRERRRRRGRGSEEEGDGEEKAKRWKKVSDREVSSSFLNNSKYVIV